MSISHPISPWAELGNHSVLPLTITLNVSLLNPFLSLLVMVCFSFLLAWPTSATSPLWHLDTSIYLIFGRRSALYNFLWSLIPSLTSPVDVLFTVPGPPRPAKEKSCTIPHLFKTIHVWNYGRKKILLFFNASITSDTFVYIAWSASVKTKSVSSSFMVFCILPISAATNLVSVGEKGKGGKHTQWWFNLWQICRIDSMKEPLFPFFDPSMCPY